MRHHYTRIASKVPPELILEEGPKDSVPNSLNNSNMSSKRGTASKKLRVLESGLMGKLMATTLMEDFNKIEEEVIA